MVLFNRISKQMKSIDPRRIAGQHNMRRNYFELFGNKILILRKDTQCFLVAGTPGVPATTCVPAQPNSVTAAFTPHQESSGSCACDEPGIHVERNYPAERPPHLGHDPRTRELRMTAARSRLADQDLNHHRPCEELLNTRQGAVELFPVAFTVVLITSSSVKLSQ